MKIEMDMMASCMKSEISEMWEKNGGDGMPPQIDATQNRTRPQALCCCLTSSVVVVS